MKLHSGQKLLFIGNSITDSNRARLVFIWYPYSDESVPGKLSFIRNCYEAA